MSSIPLIASDVASFRAHLSQSHRILALLGAGLSASSGLATFRGVGGLWRSHDATTLATPEAFSANPALVWQFYGERRRAALRAQPNAAHHALVELAKRKPEFLCLTQNVDGLSQRAGHPSSQLLLLHGSLFDLRCTEFYCDYSERENFSHPLMPGSGISGALGLSPSRAASEQELAEGTPKDADRNAPRISSNAEARQSVSPVARAPTLSGAAASSVTEALGDPLPSCPSCHGLLRPGVVWFNEILPQPMLEAVDAYIAAERIDLMLVVGTRATVYPAASYVEEARARGARIAVINTDASDMPPGGLNEGDWAFVGDAAVILPLLIGEDIRASQTQ